jgi:hypothetical protein
MPIKSLFKFLQATPVLQLHIKQSITNQLFECVNISFSNNFTGFSEVCNFLVVGFSGISSITSLG